MLNLTQKNRVYVVCPANFATGGPELLHQLAFKLRAMGVEAWMYYFNTGEENPVHPNYKHYKVPFETRIPNNSDSWMVILKLNWIYYPKKSGVNAIKSSGG
jgi:hypothetical protein